VDGLGVCQSYAETFKLLCDLSEVPAVVARGTLGSVPHAWNKVMIGNQWYNVDVTNNDDNVLPYPVYNASDRMLMKYYCEDPSYALDSEFLAYSSYDDSQDYYYKAGLFSRNADELKKLIADQLSTASVFFIKTDTDLTEEAVIESVVQAIEESGQQDSEIKLIYHMNILGIRNG
jgi:hypothetical protein